MSTAEKGRGALAFVTEAEPIPASAEFETLCASFGIELDARERDQLGQFLALLLANDALLNLTAIRDPAAGWVRHVFDALTLLSVLSELPPGAKLADLGSGSGVPALPLAIVLPQHRFTLIESTRKKADYLASTARALGLSNVEIVAERAEALATRQGFREGFDVVTARAVGALELLVRLAFPLLRVEGRAVFVKGERARDELMSAAPTLLKLGGEHEGTIDTPTGKLVVLAKHQAAQPETKKRKKKYRF